MNLVSITRSTSLETFQFLIQPADTQGHLLHNLVSEGRVLVDSFQKGTLVQGEHPGTPIRAHSGRPGLLVEYGHFAEYISRFQLTENDL